MNKLFKKLFAPIAVLSMALGVSVSTSMPKDTIKVNAAVGDIVYSMSFAAQNSAFGTSNAYAEKTGTISSVEWKLSMGSAQSATDLWVGSNSKNKANLVLLDSSASSYNYSYVRAALGTSATDVYYSALVSQDALSNVGKLVVTTPTIGGTAAQMYLATSSGLNTNYSLVTLTSGTQGSSVTAASTITYEFSTITSAFYAIIYKSTNDFTVRTPSFSFYEGVTSSATLTGISITSQPTKKQYYSGETLDTTGLVVTASYSDSTDAIVTGSCSFDPTPLTAGTTNVIVSYTEGAVTKTATISGLTVLTKTLNSISINTATSKLTFTLGETFVYPGLVIDAHYNGGTEEITSGFSVNGVDTMILGPQTATITFEEMTTSYAINVTNEGASVGPVSTTNDLFISEYIEGTSNNKAIEIYNGTGATVDLSKYSVGLHSSAVVVPGTTQVLSGTLANGEVFVIANSESQQSILDIADLTSTVTYYNGDDAITLWKEGVVIDKIGNIDGTDPGVAWTGTGSNSASASTLNKTLIRTAATLTPNANFDFTSSIWSEWEAYDVDTFSNLGSHTHASNDVTVSQQATAFANYVMTGKGSDAEGECEAVLTELQAEFDFMVEDAQLEFETNPATLFVDARARMAYLEAWVGVPAGQITRPESANTTRNNLFAVITIGAIGLTSILAYYFLNKKKAFR